MAAPADAQFADEEVPPAIRLGVLGLNPFVRISDVGVDSNVHAASENARRDFTARISPGVNTSLRMGRARLTFGSAVGFSYFQETKQSRTRDVRQTGKVAVVLNRLTPRLEGSYDATRDRPNLEIDARVRRIAERAGAGLDVRVGPRVGVSLDATRTTRRYDSGEQFNGASLRHELDQRTERASVAVRMALTPLTTLAVVTDYASDRFPSSPVRNTDSVGVLPGFELKPLALISGTAFVGYRRVDVLDPAVPDFSGVVANVSVAYTLRGRTRFDLEGARGIDYSVDSTTPYYVVEGGSLTLTQALGRGWDARGTWGATTLAYQDRQDVSMSELRRGRDRLVTYGVGIGRRLGTSARLGMDVLHGARRSPLSSRTYEGWRAGGSFTYGP